MTRVVQLVVVRVPAKRRLVATLAECARIVNGMPDPMCDVLEQSGLFGAWRSQLESLAHVTERVMSVSDVLRSAHRAVQKVAPILEQVQRAVSTGAKGRR